MIIRLPDLPLVQIVLFRQRISNKLYMRCIIISMSLNGTHTNSQERDSRNLSEMNFALHSTQLK